MTGNADIRQRIVRRILSAVLLVAVFTGAGCGKTESESARRIAKTSDLNNSAFIVAGEIGTSALTVAAKTFPNAKLKNFNFGVDIYPALTSGKIDAVVFNRPALEYAALHNPDFAILPENLADGSSCVGAPLPNQALIQKVNAFIRQYRNDGTDQEMFERWVRSKQPAMPEIPTPPNPVGVLKIGTDCVNAPMSFLDSGKRLVGFNVEFARRLALHLKMKCEFKIMDREALLPACASGDVDLVIANPDAAERRQDLLYSESYLASPIAVMIRRQDLAAPGPVTALKDLKGKTAASLTGAGFQQLTEPLQTGINYIFFNDNHSSVMALRTGKADAVLIDKPMAQLFASRFPDDIYLASVYAKDRYGYAFRQDSPLTEPASRVIRKLKESGEMDRLIEKWCARSEADKKLADWNHKKDFTGANGTLRFASDMTQEPMCYADADGKPLGLDVEIMRRVAYELNMKFEFISLSFGSLIEALLSRKVDAVGGSMSITEERKKRVAFAECYYEGGLSILARRDRRDTPGSLAELAGKRIGVLSGTTMDSAVAKHMPDAKPIYLNSFTDLPIALETGKIDAFLLEEPQFRLLSKTRPNLTVLPDKLSSDEYAFLFAEQKKELCEAFTTQIRAMKADGTLKQLDDKWFSGDESSYTLPPPPANPSGGVLRFATVPQLAPFSFMKNGKIVGYDIEVAQLAAAKLGYALEPVSMEWSSLIEAVAAGKADIGGGCVTITPERKEKVRFSEPDYTGGLVVVVPKDGVAQRQTSVRSWFADCGASLRESFDRTFLRENRWKLVLDGLKVTVLITVLAAVFGTLLAFPVCFLRRSRRFFPRLLGKLFISLMQGTPILVILMILYYVIFAKIDLDAVVVAVIGFGLNFAAYAGEMLRTGIDAVPRGQREAALALGFSNAKTFLKVILPQALRQVLPVYRGEFINMLKTTSIVGYIAIQDLTKMSDIIRSRTYEAFFPLIATAVIYFATAWVLALGLTLLERRLDPLSRRKNRRKEMPRHD